MLKRTNENGLTFDEWFNATSLHVRFKRESVVVCAWSDGEDPTEWRHAHETGTLVINENGAFVRREVST